MEKKYKISPDEIEDYLNGKNDPILNRKIGKWLVESGYTKETTSLLYKLWKKTENRTNKEATDKAFILFKNRIGFDKISSFHKIALWTMRVASIGLIVLLSYISFFRYDSSQMDWKEKYVVYGSKEELVLPDGSHLWLNSGTHVLYPENFGKKTREIFITGEAYMNIAKDPERPFVVSTSTVSIKVLGTQFNLKSYVEDENVVINLIEGSVSISNADEDNEMIKIMNPGDVLSYNKSDREFSSDFFSVDSYTSWKDGHLFFRNESLGTIAAHLERRYNVKIVIYDDEIRNKKFYVAFVNNETLDQIFEAFNVDGEMTISRKDNLIEVSRR